MELKTGMTKMDEAKETAGKEVTAPMAMCMLHMLCITYI
jgi:hypothetical protein